MLDSILSYDTKKIVWNQVFWHENDKIYAALLWASLRNVVYQF